MVTHAGWLTSQHTWARARKQHEPLVTCTHPGKGRTAGYGTYMAVWQQACCAAHNRHMQCAIAARSLHEWRRWWLDGAPELLPQLSVHFEGGGALGPGQTQFQAWCACDVRDVLCPVSCQYCGVHICTALAKCITCKLHTTTQHLPPCGYQLCTQLHWPTTMHECLGSRLSVCRAVYLVVVQSTCLVVAGFESILKPVGCWT
jgi:hypothetical protein